MNPFLLPTDAHVKKRAFLTLCASVGNKKGFSTHLRI